MYTDNLFEIDFLSSEACNMKFVKMRLRLYNTYSIYVFVCRVNDCCKTKWTIIQLHHGENKLHHGENKLHHGENKLHHGENKLRHGENKLHHSENKLHHGENKLHHGENKVHHGENKLNHGENKLLLDEIMVMSILYHTNAELNFYNTSLLKQQSICRHVAQYRNFILTPSKPVFVLTS
jgi:hypothetical protein